MTGDQEPEVGTAAWLERVREQERAGGSRFAKPPAALVQVVLGVVLVAIGVALNVFVIGTGRDALFELTGTGFLVVRVLPVVVGVIVIIDGDRQR